MKGYPPPWRGLALTLACLALWVALTAGLYVAAGWVLS
jgi:hypothetical protein